MADAPFPSTPNPHGTLTTPALPPFHAAAEGEDLAYLVPNPVPGLRKVSEKPPVYEMDDFLTPEVCLPHFHLP